MNNIKIVLLSSLIFMSLFSFAYAVGCDDSLDTNTNNNTPGNIILSMHNITTATTSCISGTSAQSEGSPQKNDYYYFTVAEEGTLTMTTSSPNSHSYHLRIGTTANGTEHYGDTTAQSHNIPSIFLSAGETIYFKFKETGSNTDEYQMNLTFTPGPAPVSLTSNNSRPFTKVNVAGNASTNIYGDLMMIGNQSLCWQDGGSTCEEPGANYSNNNYRQDNINLDPVAITNGFANSTSADLTLGADDRVVEAWLYWIGRLSTNNQTTRASAATIQLKTPTSGGYVSLTATEKFNWMVDGSTFDYGAGIDVTQYVQQDGRYWVADLKATEMKNQGSGWTLAIIVEDTATSKTRTLKNISLYDGFTGVFNSSSYPSTVSSTISGFLTPRSGTVKSNLIVFAGESDRALDDSMSITKKDGTVVPIEDSLGDTDNVQNGTISRNGVNVTDRNPNFENTLGIDIDEIDVSTIIDNDQTSTIITLDSKDDRIFLGMYGFATELYIPRLCYDYNVRKNGFTLDSENRDITTVGTGELAVNVSIRSMEGDFDLSRSKLKLRLTPSAKVSFLEATYSPNTVNTLIPAIHSAGSTSQNPEIAIGANATTLGGTIGIFERYFTSFKYDITDAALNGQFEADLNTSIDFGSGPVNVLLSTENATIPRCEQTNVYAPEWGMFNIERTDSGNFNPSTQPTERFPLYTQIAGRDFDFSLVAYDGNTTPPYSVEVDVANLTVDVELIDASPYDDNGSFFKCTNTDPSIIQTFDNGSKNFFASFPSTATNRVDLANAQNVDVRTNTALRNAAFRMWLLVDSNDTIIPHQCALDDNACFENLYSQPTLQDTDTTGLCYTRCTTGTNPASNSDCYDCLRTYFAKPVCSRDNFSIRPASYRIAITDTNESTDITDPTNFLGINDSTNLIATLAAGYNYKIDANATLFGTDDNARGYNRDFFTPSNADLTSQLLFNTPGTCRDTNNSDLGIRFEDGRIQGTFNGTTPDLYSNNLQMHNNVGRYDYHVEDNNWTIVDQQRYPYKTFPNTSDCLDNNSNISATGNLRSGCGISSQLTGTPLYEDMTLYFEPYSYDVSSIVMSTPNNTTMLYTNNLNTNNIAARAMAVRFNGPLVARGKMGNALSNYTNGCVAKDVLFDINRTISQNNVQIAENSILAVDPCTLTPTTQKINLQRYDSSDETNNTLQFSSEDNTTNTSTAITVAAVQFKDEDNGSANIRLEYNFNRPCPDVSNPLDVNFTSKDANSVLATSSTHLRANYIPEGTQTINSRIQFIYGRIAPSSANPYIVPRTQTQTTIPFYVEGFCAGLDANGNTINCGNYNLTTASLRDSGTWWVNTNHNSLLGDGDIQSITDTNSPSPLTITPNANVALTNPTNISVSINPSTPRPYVTNIVITPSDPWLIQCPTACYGVLNPTVNFQGGGGWAGKGNTGLVVDTNASFDDTNKRSEW